MLFTEQHTQPTTAFQCQLHSIAHDVLSAHHGRNFQHINWLLSQAEGSMFKQQVGVFDMEERNGQTSIHIRHFGDNHETATSHSINLLVWKGHMRCLPRTNDTKPTAWRDRGEFVDTVSDRKWKLWSEAVGADPEDPAPMEIRACRSCRKLRRYVPIGTTYGYGHLGTGPGGAVTTEKNCWERVNPQSHFQKGDMDHQAQWIMFNRAWRPTSPVALQVKELFNGLEDEFSADQFSELAKRGAQSFVIKEEYIRRSAVRKNTGRG